MEEDTKIEAEIDKAQHRTGGKCRRRLDHRATKWGSSSSVFNQQSPEVNNKMSESQNEGLQIEIGGLHKRKLSASSCGGNSPEGRTKKEKRTRRGSINQGGLNPLKAAAEPQA